MERTTWAVVLAVLAAAAALAVAVPVSAQTGTGGENGTNGTVGTAVEVSFDRSLSESERQHAVAVVEARLDAVPGHNGTVRTTADRFVVQVKPAAPPRVVDDLLQRGNFSLTARAPNATARLLSNADVVRVGQVQSRNGVPVLPVALSNESAGRFSGTLQRLGFATPAAVENCEGSGANATGYCLTTRLDGGVLNTAGVTRNLARAVAADYFNESQAFVIAAEDRAPLERLRVALADEPLPADAAAASVENVTAFDPVTPAADTGTSPGPDTRTSPGSDAETPPGPDSTTTGEGSPGFTALLAGLALAVLGLLAAQTVRN